MTRFAVAVSSISFGQHKNIHGHNVHVMVVGDLR